jgi:23S rRNA pseudouridine1911/1915/1917 synthase
MELNSNSENPPLEHMVTEEENEWSVKDIMRKTLGISRKHLSRLKLTDGVRLNGKSVYVSQKVKPGDRVSAMMAPEESEDILPQPMELHILYEDEDVLLLDKPAGVIVHPTHGHYMNTLANGVVHYWLEKGVTHRFRPVNRLDQDTSGVICIAKNKHAHHQLSKQWQKNQVEKGYWAIVEGELNPAQGTVNAPIDRCPEDPKRRIVIEGGYSSITHYEVVEKFPKTSASWVRIQLETGRTHQIRVHMTYLGHPLVGDTFYGSKSPRFHMQRQALHAYRLVFDQPRTGQKLTIEAPMPADIKHLIEELRGEG